MQDPRTILLLFLLATAITLNLLGLFKLPVLGGESNPRSGFATGALAAFVATPCAGPFMGAALGTALLLPAAGAMLVFAGLGLGLALPFLLLAFVPSLRKRLPRPGPWMARLQHILAVPMALSALAALWLLWRQGGTSAVLLGLVSAALLVAAIVVAGRRQGQGQPALNAAVVALLLLVAVPLLGIGRDEMAVTTRGNNGEAWSEAKVAAARAAGRPVFVYFTADWCLSCKVNEASTIDREFGARCPQGRQRRSAGRRLDQCRSGDHPLPGQPRARGDPALPLVCARRRRARGTAAGTHTGNADRAGRGGTGADRQRFSHTFRPEIHVSSTCVRARSCGDTAAGSRSTKMKSAC